MSQRIVVDPITRIEGHLRIEATVEDGYINDAYSTGTMIRGIELIARDRDPRDVWAFVGRICGVCTSMHSLASVRAVENALGIVIPPNAEQVRNLMLAALYIQDHILHFYQLQAFDWVDVMSALKADPKKASEIAQSLTSWPKSSPGYFSDVQKKLRLFMENGQLGIFSNGYWGHPAYKLPPEVNLIAVVHYLEALEMHKSIVRIQTIFGGKNPHPNFLVGGMACAVNTDDENALNMERLSYVAEVIKNTQEFVDMVFIPDLMAIAPYYTEWTKIGGGLHNYICYGEYPMGRFGDYSTYKLPHGIIRDRNLKNLEYFDPTDINGLQEFVNNSWYNYTQGKDVGLHPSVGETILNYTGPATPYEYLDFSQPYSWIKTPRYKGMPMETGPLARMLVGYAAGREDYIEIIDSTLSALNLPLEAMFSTLGRLSARVLETKLVASWMTDFYTALLTNIRSGDSRMFNGEKWEPDTWPKEAAGYGLGEAPRGSLAHYVGIKNKLIDRYQAVVPTTWNGSPRDPKGQRSSFEASLLQTPVADINQPLEILRTIHSFDPCMACSVHLYDEQGSYIHQFDLK